MGKFVLKDLKKKIQEKGLAEKAKILLTAKGMSKVCLDKLYSIYFWSMDGFLSGEPSWWQTEGWKLYVVSGIDSKYNKEAQERAKQIHSTFKSLRIVHPKDRVWIKEELKPYFEKSLREQTGKTIGMIDAVDEGKMKEFLKQVKKEKEGRFK
jgi:hypothetical protein